MKGFRNYIFDLYGTLFDISTDESGRRLWRLSALYYSEHGAGYAAEELRRRYLELCAEEQGRSPDPLYELELRDVFRRLYIEKGTAPDDRLIADTAVFFRLTSTKKLRLYPWVKPVFGRIREAGARIFLLSNAQACFTEPELIAMGIGDAFDGIVLSSDAGVRKPDPRIMETLLDRFGLSADESIMIGNDQRADMGTARAVGMEGLFIRTATSGEYDPELAVGRELLDGAYHRLPVLMGLENG